MAKVSKSTLSRAVASANSSSLLPLTEMLEVVSLNPEKKQRAPPSSVPTAFIDQILKMLTADGNIGTLTNKDVKSIAESFVKVLVDGSSSGNTVAFRNTLSFKRVLRGDRTHKNPRDGTPIFKPAHYVLTLDVMPQLKHTFCTIPVSEGDVVSASENDNEGSGSSSDAPAPVPVPVPVLVAKDKKEKKEKKVKTEEVEVKDVVKKAKKVKESPKEDPPKSSKDTNNKNKEKK